MPHETSGSEIAKQVADLGGTPWGQKEICAFTGKTESAVRQWVFYKPTTEARPAFPKPDYIVGGRPAWAECTLLAYWVRWGYTRDEAMPADMLRRAKTRLRKWGVRPEGS
jgi:hypothetical protein